MTRAIQIDDEEVAPSVSVRQELMSMEKHELVSLLEEATGAEIGARRIQGRLLQRVAAAEEIGKHIERRAKLMIETVELEAWDAATGGSTTALNLVTLMLRNAVADLVARSGKERLYMARFQSEIMSRAFQEMETDPNDAQRGGCEDETALQFYIICQLGNVTPKGWFATAWFDLGKELYKPG
jgi:hypothetical protein